MNDLYDKNPNYTYLIDNASIHKNKKKMFFIKKNTFTLFIMQHINLNLTQLKWFFHY
jgi:hypothetical protein